MATMVKVSELYFPNRREYVRGTVNKLNRERLEAALVGKDWPFPPILVRKLDKPLKRKKMEYRLAIVDGVTRASIALRHKIASIPADVRPMTDTEAAVEQLRLNDRQIGVGFESINRIRAKSVPNPVKRADVS